jgi:hypothetical protein
MKFETLLKRCFSDISFEFGVHPLDSKRAKAMFDTAIRENIPMRKILELAKSFLEENHCDSTKIDQELKRIQRHKHRIKSTLKATKAWLITSEYTDGRESDVVTFISGRKSSDTVLELMEQLYLVNECSNYEKLHYSKSRRNNPYPAEYHRRDGIPYSGLMFCGSDPFYKARKVENVVVDIEGVSCWDELTRT